ncbi:MULTISPECIES: hypothetical protein [unclassified Flavobacterium]|jgi:hypothetical protein|uniref:hypothetical protein n=1 Tax=unclassified Flavobacterium TaxID=196869 RepID=UPI0025BE3FC3|nr:MULTISPECIES: hypothetical protein [unclassified Flavobacterium]
MNNFSKIYGSKKNSIIFMMFVFVLLSNVSVFGQTSIENNVFLNNTIINDTAEISVGRQEATTTFSNMNFVLWFMGSKQDPNVKISPTGENTRRQFITSGLAPNRLLIKAFLKKAVNFEIGVA